MKCEPNRKFVRDIKNKLYKSIHSISRDRCRNHNARIHFDVICYAILLLLTLKKYTFYFPYKYLFHVNKHHVNFDFSFF